MKLQVKRHEWAILIAVPTGICAARFAGGNSVLQGIICGVISGLILRSWEVTTLKREVQKLRDSSPKPKI